jgi:hypothetical protein
MVWYVARRRKATQACSPSNVFIYQVSDQLLAATRPVAVVSEIYKFAEKEIKRESCSVFADGHAFVMDRTTWDQIVRCTCSITRLEPTGSSRRRHVAFPNASNNWNGGFDPEAGLV